MYRCLVVQVSKILPQGDRCTRPVNTRGSAMSYPLPRIEALSFLITAPRAFSQFIISRNVRQSFLDNDSVPEEEVVGVSWVLHRNCVDGRWKNLCACSLAWAEWIDWNELRLPMTSYARTTI